MPGRCRWMVVMALLALLGNAAADEPAATPEAEAARLTEMGTSAWQRAEHALALEYFELAYRVYPSPRLHYNRALALTGLARPLAAADAYEQFLREALESPAENRDYARAELTRIDRLLGQLTVTSNVADAELSIDGRPATAGRPVRVEPGQHAVFVHKVGFRSATGDPVLAAGQQLRVNFELAALDLRVPARTVAPPVKRPAPEPMPAPRRRSLLRSPWLWGTVGLLFAVTVTAVVVVGTDGEVGCAPSDLGCLRLAR